LTPVDTEPPESAAAKWPLVYTAFTFVTKTGFFEGSSPSFLPGKTKDAADAAPKSRNRQFQQSDKHKKIIRN
ncbi:MAG: hypothetical protein IJN41_07085, partial [Firmicutes bacterium]|nr:hypothetical protein [Bacillota bacterium]